MHQALHSIYELNLKKSSLFASLKGKLFAYLSSGNFEKTIDDIWKENISPGAIPAELFNATYNELNKQVDDAFGEVPYGDENYDLANAMRRDAAKFATHRNYQYLAELEAKKIDTITGEVLNEADFKKVAKGVHYKYQNYAEVEKDLAFKTADMAVKWQEFERTKDLYPNLEYRPSKAAEPREAHRQYYGLIKPIDDAIWASILPPNGYGCSCTVRKTRAEADDASYEVEKPKPGIVGNGAKSKQLFADNHPYYKNTPKEAKDLLNENFNKLKETLPYNNKPDYVSKKGKLYVHPFADNQKNSLIENYENAKLVVDKFGYEIKVRPHINRTKQTNPEYFINNIIGDLKEPKSYNAINTRLKTLNDQAKGFTGNFIAIVNLDKFTEAVDSQLLTNRLRGTTNNLKNLDEVLINYKDKSLSVKRNEILGDKKALITKIKKVIE